MIERTEHIRLPKDDDFQVVICSLVAKDKPLIEVRDFLIEQGTQGRGFWLPINRVADFAAAIEGAARAALQGERIEVSLIKAHDLTTNVTAITFRGHPAVEVRDHVTSITPSKRLAGYWLPVEHMADYTQAMAQVAGIVTKEVAA